MRLNDIVSLYNIPQNIDFVLKLEQILTVITAKDYFFNFYNQQDFYSPSIIFMDGYPDPPSVTETSQLFLKLFSKLPPKNNIRIMQLEMELEHVSLLVLDYRDKTFNVIDPVCGCSKYGYMEESVIPELYKILGWKYFNPYIGYVKCKGPQSKTQDNYCYIWSILIVHILNTSSDYAYEIFDNLNELSAEDLNLLISRFITYLYTVLLNDGSVVIFQAINKNKDNFCYHLVHELTNTMCSIKYDHPNIDIKDLMKRYNFEIDNYKMGCNVKNLSTNIS